jgi:hypothetical protein
MTQPYTKYVKPPDDGVRYYEIDGQRLPSVTTILSLLEKKALIPWATKCMAKNIESRLDMDSLYSKHDIVNILTDSRDAWVEESRVARETGTSVHSITESLFKSLAHGGEKAGMLDRDPVTIEEINCVKAAYDWLLANDVRVIVTEEAVSHTGYAGRIDLAAVVNGVPTLVDIKTSKSIYPEYRMQVAAYLHAYNRDKPVADKLSCAAILRLDKSSGEFEYKVVRSVEKQLAKFLSLAGFYALYKDDNPERAFSLFEMSAEQYGRKKGATKTQRKINRQSKAAKSFALLVESTSEEVTDSCDPFV